MTRAVVDFDHHSARNSNERQAVLDEVREHQIFWTEEHGGYWVTSSFQAARQVLRDQTHFSTTKHADGTGGVTIPTAPGPLMLPAEVDGEYHKRLKAIMLAKLSRTEVDRLEPWIKSIVTEAVDEILEKGSFDVVHDLADVIPARVVVMYLGFPEEARRPFIKAVQDSVSAIPMVGGIPEGGPTPEMLAAVETFVQALDTIKALITERRAEPREDLISYWLDPAHGLTDDEVMWMTFTLVLGGAENPAALIENTMLWLHRDHALRDRLREDPALLPAVTDEFLRVITAGVSLGRNCIQETEVCGQQLQPGERVCIWLPAANHDARVYGDPDRVDLDRGVFDHVAFGSGAHRCPGSFLTRLEFRLVFEEILARMPDFTIDETGCERFDDASLAYCFRTMPAATGIS